MNLVTPVIRHLVDRTLFVGKEMVPVHVRV